jgi:hypothetical protein
MTDDPPVVFSAWFGLPVVIDAIFFAVSAPSLDSTSSGMDEWPFS